MEDNQGALRIDSWSKDSQGCPQYMRNQSFIIIIMNLLPCLPFSLYNNKKLKDTFTLATGYLHVRWKRDEDSAVVLPQDLP